MAYAVTEFASSLNSPYLNFILKTPLPQLYHTCLLLLARILPIFAIVPYLGGKLFPAPMKVGISLSWLFIILPQLLVLAQVPANLPIELFYSLIIKEVLLGFLIGFLLSIPFYAAQSAGSFLTNQQGIQGLEGATSLISIEQTSPHGILYHYFVSLMFWFAGGPIITLQLLLLSLDIIPLHQFFPPGSLSLYSPLLTTMIKLCQLCLIMTIQLSAPATIAMLMSDLFLGIINRMAPQVQVIYLLSALKAFMGMLFLFLAWFFIVKQIDLFTLAWLQQMPKMLFNTDVKYF